MAEIEPELFQSREFLEKQRILEIEKEVIELRHRYRTDELLMERKLHHEEHLERMAEIRLKNRNIQRSIEDKDRRIREYHEKRRQRFAEQNNGKPTQSEEEES